MTTEQKHTTDSLNPVKWLSIFDFMQSPTSGAYWVKHRAHLMDGRSAICHSLCTYDDLSGSGGFVVSDFFGCTEIKCDEVIALLPLPGCRGFGIKLTPYEDYDIYANVEAAMIKVAKEEHDYFGICDYDEYKDQVYVGTYMQRILRKFLTYLGPTEVRDKKERDTLAAKVKELEAELSDARLIMREKEDQLIAANLRIVDMEDRKDSAYEERNRVVAALAKCFPSIKGKTAIDGWSEDWHHCVYITLPTGQASWHYHNSHANLFEDITSGEAVWDGHSTEEKYRRLHALPRIDGRVAQLEEQRDELLNYVDHEQTCIVFGSYGYRNHNAGCSCGYDDIIAKIEAEKQNETE